jgi:hypothetical protein
VILDLLQTDWEDEEEEEVEPFTGELEAEGVLGVLACEQLESWANTRASSSCLGVPVPSRDCCWRGTFRGVREDESLQRLSILRHWSTVFG